MAGTMPAPRALVWSYLARTSVPYGGAFLLGSDRCCPIVFPVLSRAGATMITLRQRCLTWGASVLLFVVAGCNDGPKIVKVTGILTYKGQPVANAILQFLPEHGRQSWAQTDDRGQFKINYDQHQDGAVVGKHKVWIQFRPSTR